MKKKKKPKRKPKKPYPDFPLFAHANGSWAKKIKKKTEYFGPWGDSDGALKNYLKWRDDLQAGLRPRQDGSQLTVVDMCNQFLGAMQLKMERGRLTPRTWNDYHRIVGKIVGYFGKERLVESLRPQDFQGFLASFPPDKIKSPTSVANLILRTRIVFGWAKENALIKDAMNYGTEFKLPSAKEKRKMKNISNSRVMPPEALKTILEASELPLRAMILLGINCGFGQTDVSGLTVGAVDLNGLWINYPRAKTAIMRRCPIWTETADALKSVLESRPVDPSELVFVRKDGRPWLRTRIKDKTDKSTGAVLKGAVVFVDSIGQEFDKLVKTKGLERRGSFYNLRHCFRTLADGCKDQPALDAIMGHANPSMAANYREGVEDERLRAVADYLHDKIWPINNTAAQSCPDLF